MLKTKRESQTKEHYIYNRKYENRATFTFQGHAQRTFGDQ